MKEMRKHPVVDIKIAFAFDQYGPCCRVKITRAVTKPTLRAFCKRRNDVGDTGTPDCSQGIKKINKHICFTSHRFNRADGVFVRPRAGNRCSF